MAVVQFTAAISEIRGKLNGSVFNKSGNAYTLGNKNQPKRERSRAQRQVQAGFTVAAEAWAALPGTIKSDWELVSANYPQTDRFGNTVTLAANQYFRKCQQWLFPEGGGVVQSPNTATGSAYEFANVTMSATANLEGDRWKLSDILVTADLLNSVPQACKVKFSISQGRRSNFGTYHGTFYDIGIFDIPGGLPTGPNFASPPLEVLMPEGFITYEGAQHVFKMQAFNPEFMCFGVEQLADGQLTIQPDIIFPTFLIDVGPFLEGEPQYTGGEWLAYPWFQEITPGNIPWSEIQISLSFGTLQFTDDPPPPNIYGPERLQGWIGPFDTNWRTSPGPPGDVANEDLVFSVNPPPYNPFVPNYLPIRIRLFHTPSGTYSDYTVKPMLVTFG